MIRPAALAIGFGLTLLAGKAANIVAGLGLTPAASSVGVLQLLPPQATACDGGFTLSSAAPSHTHDGAVSCTPFGSPAANAVGLLSVGVDARADAPATITTLPDGGSRDDVAVPRLNGSPPPYGGRDMATAWVGEKQPECFGSLDEGAGSGNPAHPDRLLSALIAVESGGNPLAVGDGGRAIGCLQIHRVMVDDCARLAPSERFTYADRLSPERSRRMAEVFWAHYCPNGTDEQKARMWNGGPTGDRKQSTEPYWRHVQAAMNERNDR